MDMRDCIYEQPAVLENIFKNRKENLKDFLDFYKEVDPDHIYIIACGSSYNASAASVDFMSKMLKVDVTLHFPSKLPTIYAKRPLCIAVSQGGESTNTIAAVKALSKYPLIAATGVKECTVNDLCDRHFDIGCGIETVGPKTKGYTATIMSFNLFALEAGYQKGTVDQKDYEYYCSLFENVPANMKENIDRCDKFTKAHIKELSAIKKIAFTGKGIGGILAKECALKVLETLLIPAINYEFEEYLHGPICAIDSEMAGVYLLSNDFDKERIYDVAKAHSNYCKESYIVTSDEAITGDKVLHILSSNDDATASFEYILFCQFVASDVPIELDTVNKGMRQFSDFNKLVQIKAKR